MPLLPQKFIERIERQFPHDAAQMLAALDTPPSTSVLRNSRKSVPDDLSGSAVPWHRDGLIMDQRPAFALDPLWHAGAYYSQESSGMFLGFLLEESGLSRGARFLDLCAAPGGKSMVISAFMDDNGLLVSNEMHPLRAAILKENIVKHGRTNIAVTRNTPDELSRMGPVFDMVLVDAPCSGEGMFRKDPEARSEWNPGLPVMCAARQTDILRSAVQLLRPGGLLVYSTCTFAFEENEQMVAWLETEHGFETFAPETPSEWPLQRTKNAFRFAPHFSPGEGLFMAALRKPTGQEAYGRKKNPDMLGRSKSPDMPFIPSSLTVPVFFTRPKEQQIFACSEPHFDFVNALTAQARVIHFPLEVGELKGRDLVPAHHLAMCAPSSATRIELSETEALDFLRKNEIIVNGPKGWALVAFKGRALGWVKNLGNRCNNYYPKEYRLRLKND